MADVAGHELPYGQFGVAIYEPTEKEWKLSRLLGDSGGLVLIGEPESVTIAPRPVIHTLESSSGSVPPTGGRLNQIAHLVKADPDVRPATQIISPLLQVSAAVSAALIQHDPLKGSALAFGSIPSEERHVPTPVAAFTSGSSGHELHVLSVRTERRGWDDTKYAWLEIPTIGGPRSIWYSDAGPIQQICFSQTVDRGTSTVENPVFMAVRCLTKTIVFRPNLCKDFSGDVSGQGRSNLDMCPTSDVSISDTNGQMHADIAFNPWFPRQFAIVDASGEWNVWDLGSRRSRAQASPAYKKTPLTDRISPTSDGWARILWVGGPTIIVVCTRRTLEIYDIASGDRVRIDTVDMVMLTAASCVLDIKTLPAHSAHCCCLTSTHILVIHVRQRPGLVSNSHEAVVVMKLAHFWGPHDLTLTLSVAADGDEDIIILLGSRSMAPVMTYRARLVEHRCSLVSDPSTVMLPASAYSLYGYTNMSLDRVNYGNRGNRWGAGQQWSIVTGLRAIDVRIFYLTILQSDGTIKQMLYADKAYATGPTTLTPTTWRICAQTKSVRRLEKERFVIDDDDNDDDEEDLLNTGGANRRRPISSRQLKELSSATHRNKTVWPINYKWAARRVDDQDADSRSIGKALDLIAIMLQEHSDDRVLPLKTLLELGNTNDMAVDDIGVASARLRSLALCKPAARPLETDDDSAGHEMAQLEIHSLAWSYDLQHVYQHMIGDWISPLSAQVSGRLRLAKDRILRNAASEVALASRTIRGKTVDDPPVEPDASTASRNVVEFCSPADAPRISMLPTPSPTATPSIATATSVSTSQAFMTIASAEVARLARYTTFTPLASSCPPPRSLPRTLANTLSHWSLDADPSEYDHIASSRHIISQQYEEEDDRLAEKEHAYARKKAERHIKRQRREAEEMESRRLQSSQAMMVMSSQLPERLRGPRGSHLVTEGSQNQDHRPAAAAASQTVPGRFGGRSDRPAVRKKRKQGF